ncbi:hypothetical protein ACFXAZ_31325 [Streptomyces sp. NPDC059477]|uniref:hypothetical protein n=1 Tax=Streptomyces sp. NPDC059477 TaxID=3346847 RepID=UPI0036AA780E
MADTATLDPQQTPGTPAADTSAAGTTVVQAAPDPAPAPVPEPPAPRRGRTRAVPLLVHGTNATGTTLGAAYTAAGVPGLAAAAGVGAAVGLAALAGRRKKNAAAARRAARDAARNRSGSATGGGTGQSGRSGRGGGLLGTGRVSGSSGRGSRGGAGSSGGSSGGRMNNRSGGLNGRAGGLNGRSPGASGTGRGASGRGGIAPGSPGSPGGPRGGLNKNGGRLNTPGGRLNKNSGGMNGTGPGRPGGSGGGRNGGGSPNGGRHRKNGTGGTNGSGGAWQGVKSALGKLRRRDVNNGGGTTNTTAPKTPDPATTPKTSKTPKTPKTGGRSRVSRMLNTARSWMNRLRRTKKAKAAAKGGSGSGTAAGKVPGRVYRWRRLVLRKTGHWARCAGAGLLAALTGLATLPLGILWGTWRLFTKHRDPLHGFLFPVRIAGRIWRRFFRRSRARHDADARAEQLNLTVNDPRKDTDTSMGSSLDTSSAVLDGKNSKFALAMSASHASYAGYRPRSMMEVAAEYAGLPNALRATAATVRDMAVASDRRYPCSKRALVKLAEAAQRTANAAARADDMVVLFRAAHAFDIERILHPRTGEWMWNVTPNGAAVPEAVMFMPGRIESGCVLMSALYRTFEPVHMMQVGAEYEGMSLGLASLADSVSLLHTRTRDVYPVDDRVTDELGTITATLRAAADDAAMAAKLFAHDHRREISHNVNPRKGRSSEEMWNTPR